MTAVLKSSWPAITVNICAVVIGLGGISSLLVGFRISWKTILSYVPSRALPQTEELTEKVEPVSV
mgnify:CR=1 FL=1